MVEKTKSVMVQVEELGIDYDKICEINCGLSNIREIMDILYETVENYNTPADLEKRTVMLLHYDIKRVKQLSYIFDNEFNQIRQTLNTILEQVGK